MLSKRTQDSGLGFLACKLARPSRPEQHTPSPQVGVWQLDVSATIMEKVVRIPHVYYCGLSCIAGVIRHTVIVSQLTDSTG